MWGVVEYWLLSVLRRKSWTKNTQSIVVCVCTKNEAGYMYVVLEEDLLDLATTFVAKSFSKVFIVDKTMVVH